MHYAILCYHDEGAVEALSRDEDAALMAELATARQALTEQLGPVARLMPTTTATTLRAGPELLVMDGPFAETKEQLLDFYVVDCGSLEEAIEAARVLLAPRTAAGLRSALEIRPISVFHPGQPAA